MHVCGTIEPVFKKMKNDIYSAYQNALGLEMERILNGGMLQAMKGPGTVNPLSLMDTYEVRVADILDWTRKGMFI